jgi:uncharacterized protein
MSAEAMADRRSAPRLTAELFVIAVGDAFLVYAPLRKAAFLANAGVVNLLADLKEGSCDLTLPGTADLVEFLRRLEIIDGGEEQRPITTHTGNPRPTTVSLFLTTSCNLRCTYCYASAGDTPEKTMPLEVATAGIDFVVHNARQLQAPGIEIAYHGGGEPTGNWKTLTGSYEYARQRTQALGLHLHAALASNGVIPQRRIDWILAHLDGVSLSFDGLPEVHDAHRRTAGGKGSSRAVIHTLRRFDAAGFNYGIRVTVTREFIPRLAESIGYICAHFRPRRIQVEPAYQLGRWADAPSAETEEFIAAFREAQGVARQHAQEISFSGARVGTLSNHFCGVTQDSFCLTADGNVSGCYEVFLEQSPLAGTFLYGRHDRQENTYRFSLPVLEQLRRQSVEHRSFCQGCFARWSCGGDCYHKAAAVNGPGEFQGTDRCHIIRELTRDQLLEKIAASGGLFWHEPRNDIGRPAGKEILS